MQVLITGGTGFIGSRLALKCLERGDVVRVLGQENNAAEAENKHLIESRGGRVILASVTDRDRIFEVSGGVDCVYHLAAAQHEANVPNQRFWDVNVTGTKNILEASLEASVKRFVHGSTIGVYGPALDGVITESSPLTPDNIYGVTKLAGERLVLSFSEKLPIVVIRISETYGPGDRRLLKLFKTIKKKMFVMIGSGRNLHHPIYIDDLTDALILAATSEKAMGEIVVVTGKDYVTTNEMVNVIATELAAKIPKLRIPLPFMLFMAVLAENILRPMRIQPPIHRRRLDFFRKGFRFSTSEAFDHLGFLPKYGFAQGIQETARWYGEMGYL
jgi:nucleoside-diphosphate-sugar epimerase